MSKEEALGNGYQKAMHPDDLPNLVARFSHGITTGEECEAEVRYLRHDGVYRWSLARAAPFRDSDGKVLKWYGTNTDIDDLVRARIAERRVKEQMITLLTHADIQLFAIDAQGIVTMSEGSFSWKAENQASNSTSLQIGKDIFSSLKTIHDNRVSELEGKLRLMLNGKVQTEESYDVFADGRSYRSLLVSDIDHSGGKTRYDEGTVRGILGLTVDVTAMNEKAKLEVDNARLQTEQQIATAANRQKSVFLANMSHEIRTPIAGVMGLTEHLLSTTLDHEQRDLVDSIKLTSNALLTIVSDILDFSKVESGRLDIYEKPMDVKAAVTDMCKIFDMTARQKGLEFRCQCPSPARITVMGDDGRIRQIISNLLTNAIKFTSKGSVRLCVTTKEAGDVTMVQFKVTDTGIGISEQARKNLFQPYQQGDASTARIYGGTGLGLAICRNVSFSTSYPLEVTANISPSSLISCTVIYIWTPLSA